MYVCVMVDCVRSSSAIVYDVDLSSLSRYVDDIPRIQGELYAGLVLSTHAHANIIVNYIDAVKMEGVKGYVGVEDVQGSNSTG